MSRWGGWRRLGWEAREPYRAAGGTVPSYDLRLCDDHWVTIHATTPIKVIQSPMGINWDRPEGYSSLDDAADYAERVYRDSLTNSRDRAARRFAEFEAALARFPDADQPSTTKGTGNDDA